MSGLVRAELGCAQLAIPVDFSWSLDIAADRQETISKIDPSKTWLDESA
jgi:hypothetical protein